MQHQPSRREFVASLAGAAAGGLLWSGGRPRSRRGRLIDFHCHSVPPAWIAFLKAQRAELPTNNPWTLSKHLEDMDRGGVYTSLLSVVSPGIWHGRDLQAIRTVARQCNEFNAKLGVDHPGPLRQLCDAAAARHRRQPARGGVRTRRAQGGWHLHADALREPLAR